MKDCTVKINKCKVNGWIVCELKNRELSIAITNYGATIMRIYMPDRHGKLGNIVAGFDEPTSYKREHPYFGALVGRYANRIANGEFSLDGTVFNLPVNNDKNHLHGGIQGFDKKLWQVDELIDDDKGAGIKLSYLSADGEEGYPGNLKATVTYLLDSNNRFKIIYEAITDKPTVVNLTSHSYFNLSAFEEAKIYNHTAVIAANLYTVKNENNVPTGELQPVSDTPLDFRTSKPLSTDMDKLVEDRGYDHNFVLNTPGDLSAVAVTLLDPHSSRVLNVYTDRPGVQVYTANWWDGTIVGSQNVPYTKHGAVAIETQSFPDSPNHPEFPTTVLRPEEKYYAETIFEFNTLS